MSPDLPYSVPPPPRARRLVACLCAEWCGTCRDYRAVMREVAGQWPADAFVWLDVEEQAELVDELDIETFPTILVIDARDVLFHGPVLPGAEALRRLLRALDENGPQARFVDEEALLLAQRLRVRAALIA
ncbi:MAG: thioredoxin family protein [Burkholderiaceae bacterium]